MSSSSDDNSTSTNETSDGMSTSSGDDQRNSMNEGSDLSDSDDDDDDNDGASCEELVSQSKAITMAQRAVTTSTSSKLSLLNRKSLPLTQNTSSNRSGTATTNTSSQPAKMRIKLSLKLPTQANARPKGKEPTVASESSDDDSEESADIVKATIVESEDDEVQEENMATVIEKSDLLPRAKASPKPALGQSTAGSHNASKRRIAHPSRPIKMPPIHSPGLLICPAHTGSASGPKAATSANNAQPMVNTNKDGYSTPASVFDHTMSIAGYNLERRTIFPHRGSSVQRRVDDMFDSDVHLALHFPPMVPAQFMRGDAANLPQQLIDCLESAPESYRESEDNAGSFRKRRRPWSFREMVPISLIVEYPETFIQKRLDYVTKVREREQAIVVSQDIHEYQKEDENSKGHSSTIPAIPDPPTPPRLSECKGIDHGSLTDECHPLYLTRGKEKLVAHLDKNCFHITGNRYFGLFCNGIADPNFIGANAPGITGITAYAVAGLATSASGSATGTAASLASSSFQYPADAPACVNGGGGGVVKVHRDKKSSALTPVSSKPKNGSNPKPSPAPQTESNKKAGAVLPSAPSTSATVKSKSEKLAEGPRATATATDLRHAMEQGGMIAERIKTTIIQSAVHGARTGRHVPCFHVPDGEVYPDLAKAFSLYAGIKPCQRCKSNKQGVSRCIKACLQF